MDEQLHHAAKVAAITGLWDQFKDLFRPEAWRAKREVKEHFQSEDPKKWKRFVDNAASSPDFAKQLGRHDESDRKLILHAVYMGALQKAPVEGEVESSSNPGAEYQIKKLPDGNLGCTCNDWRYKGSVNPGYECKHIKAFKQGRTKVAGVKSASFGEMTASFFDELQKIRDAQQKEVFRGTRDGAIDTARPYSDLLTAGETAYYNPRPANSMEDPEVIVGGGFAR